MRKIKIMSRPNALAHTFKKIASVIYYWFFTLFRRQGCGFALPIRSDSVI